MEGLASEHPLRLWGDLAHILGSTNGYRDDVLTSPTVSTHHSFPGELPRVWGSSNGKDYGDESFYTAMACFSAKR